MSTDGPIIVYQRKRNVGNAPAVRDVEKVAGESLNQRGDEADKERLHTAVECR